MRQSVVVATVGILGLVVALQGGCGRTETASAPGAGTSGDHSHAEHASEGAHGHGHPESLAEAVAEIDRLRGVIQQAFAAQKLSEADPPVHALGHLLDDVPKLAEKAALSTEEQQRVKRALEALYSAFGAVDERVHHGEPEGKSYADVASDIEAAVKLLQEASRQGKKP